MALYLIGIGLGSYKDVTLRGLEIIKKSEKIYLEEYTSRLTDSNKKELEEFYGKDIISADRDLVENKAGETILKDAKETDAVFLVIGDPFSATTHIGLRLRADKLGIKTGVINNSSILSAIGITGIDLYKFGRTTTIPFENKDVKSPYEVVKNNLKNNLHTLILLDLDPSQDKYMTINQALEYLLKQGISSEQLCVGCCQIGSSMPLIKAGKINDLLKSRFDRFPQCLIIPSKLHFMEEEVLKKWE
ncbi:MAG: diphthine synthase [Nanoarchaeota archaeon]|nr:diphthine synthase [Nanoarchaeota archaeon]